MEKVKCDILKTTSMKLFFMLCGYFLLLLILYMACQFLKFNNCLGFIQILSILIPVVFYTLFERKDKKIKKIFIVIEIFLFITLLLPFIYNKTYDLTVDGNSYHKTAIAYIKNGWNPIYESIDDFAKTNNDVIALDDDSKIDLWVEHYPKATWITAATMYNMTGNIESGKCITLIFSIMLVIISYNCLQIILSRKWAMFISILMALNPVTLSQLFSYYVDSLMGIMFAIELLLLFMIEPRKNQKENIFLWFSLASICCFFVNIKFTGLLASGVIAAVFYFYWLIKNRKEKNFFKIFKTITLCFIAIFATAIFFVGANSYIKNTIDHHNPLYPIIGKDKVDIITTMQPKSFKEKGMVEKFFISLFSKTENVTYGSGEPELKNPLKVYQSEIDALLIPDVRIGGFGPLFALTIIISTIGFLMVLTKFIKYHKKQIKFIVLPSLAIILSMILLGENWWARYIPQLYLFPIGVIVLMVYVSSNFKYKKIPLVFNCVIIGVLFLNCYYFLCANNDLLKTFSQINNDIIEMKNTKNLKLHITTEGLDGYYYTLNDLGVKYEVKQNIKEKNMLYKYSWRVVVEQK